MAERNDRPAIGRMLEGLEPMRDAVRQEMDKLRIANRAARDVRPPFLPLIGYRQLAEVRQLEGLPPQLVQDSLLVQGAIKKVRAQSVDMTGKSHPFEVRIINYARERSIKAKTPTLHVVATVYDIPRGDDTFEFAAERHQLRAELDLEEEGAPTTALNYDWTLARMGMDQGHKLRPVVQALNVGQQVLVGELAVELVPGSN